MQILVALLVLALLVAGGACLWLLRERWRLAGAARRAAREGAFEISREMVAAAGAGPDEVSAMLVALGFPSDGPGRHRAAKPSRAAAVR